jgi:16S rRNA G527 N7-methylase RsmG
VGQNRDLQKRFDIVTARAVDRIGNLINWGKPFLKDSGYFLFWKGESDISELEQAAVLLNCHYTIHSVPEAFEGYSRKFGQLRWFVIGFTGNKY